MFPTVTERTSEATLFSFFSNAPRSPPSRCFDVTGIRLRTWMEECRSSDSDTPPSALLLQLFASRPRRQTASRSPTCCCAEPYRLPPSTGVVYSTCAGPSRTGQRVRSPLFLLFGGNLSLCELCSQIALQDIWRKWPDLFL